MEAIERHAGVASLVRLGEGCVRRADPGYAEAARRMTKPHAPVNGDAPGRKLIVAGGRAEISLEPSDIIHAITAASDGEAVRNVQVLERFAFVEVPASEADRVGPGRRRHLGSRPHAEPVDLLKMDIGRPGVCTARQRVKLV